MNIHLLRFCKWEVLVCAALMFFLGCVNAGVKSAIALQRDFDRGDYFAVVNSHKGLEHQHLSAPERVACDLLKTRALLAIARNRPAGSQAQLELLKRAGAALPSGLDLGRVLDKEERDRMNCDIVLLSASIMEGQADAFISKGQDSLARDARQKALAFYVSITMRAEQDRVYMRKNSESIGAAYQSALLLMTQLGLFDEARRLLTDWESSGLLDLQEGSNQQSMRVSPTPNPSKDNPNEKQDSDKDKGNK